MLKVDENILDNIEDMVRLHPEGTHVVFVDSKPESSWALNAEILADMVYLCKLGLQFKKVIDKETSAKWFIVFIENYLRSG